MKLKSNKINRIKNLDVEIMNDMIIYTYTLITDARIQTYIKMNLIISLSPPTHLYNIAYNKERNPILYTKSQHVMLIRDISK